MTNRRPTASRPALSWRALLLLATLALGALAGRPAAAADMPDGVVAIVRAGPEDKQGRHLSFAGFCDACARLALPDIKRQRSGARAVLEQLIEEKMVQGECGKLGITVSANDMERLWDKLDDQVRRRSGGTRTLNDTIKAEGTNPGEFRDQLYHMIRKERIAAHPKYLGPRMPANEQAKLQQIGIVIAKIRNNSTIQYGIPILEHVRAKPPVLPANLGKGVIARVNGQDVLLREFGEALVLRLPGGKVREYLDRECKTALMSMQGLGLTQEQLDAEIDHLEKLWPLERELKRDEVWKTVSFKDRFETQFGMEREDVINDRYARGLLGLVKQMRGTITEEEIKAEYEEHKDGLYGKYLVVDLIEIGFSQKKGFGVGGRTLVEARRMANGFARRLARGEPWEKVATELNMRRDRTTRARTLRLTQTDEDRVHYTQAQRLRDGDVSTPYETLAELCVMRRVGPRPARALTEIRPYLRELLARRKARAWIEEKIKDAAWVQIRWPLPQRR